MRRYATRPEVIAESLGNQAPSGDPSLDAIIALAVAFQAAMRIRQVADLELSGRTLIVDSIERAYREALHIRATRMPSEFLDTSKLSKLGRLHGKS